MCDAPVTDGFADNNFFNNLGFQDPASPLMEGLIGLHSDIWGTMLFVAGFVSFMLVATLYSAPDKSFKVHHHNLIEIIWTTVPAIILCIIAVPSFTLLYGMDEIVQPSLTLKAIGRQWYWSAPFNCDLDWKTSWGLNISCQRLYSAVQSDRTAKYSANRILLSSSSPFGGGGRNAKSSNQLAERLKGQQHAEKGGLNRICLGYYALQTKSVMGTHRFVSGVHTPRQVGIIELVTKSRSIKSSVSIEPTAWGSLQQVGQQNASKTSQRPNHGNSGSAKERNFYVDGSPIVASHQLCEEGQPKTLDQSDVDNKVYTSEEAIPQKIINSLDHQLQSVDTIATGAYRSLFLPVIYKLAYDQIKSKLGMDGIDNAWIDQVIKRMKDRSFQFQPALRRYISKNDGKLRPLGIPTSKDKIIQQTFKLIIEPLFEPHFLSSSHAFRPNRSAHTALKDIRGWTGITWLIKGDIKDCFDRIDHKKLEQQLKNRVKDQNLISLYWKAVKAGYVNNGSLEPHSLTGVPQGSVISPLLSNVYMHELDEFMETLKKTHEITPNKGGSRQNPEYTAKLKELKRLRATKDGKAIRKAEIEHLNIPSVIRTGSRLYYVRYADDFVIGIKGTRNLAEIIKTAVETFLLRELKLELNRNKTCIIHLASKPALFLGTYIRRHGPAYSKGLVQKVGNKLVRRSNTRIILDCPINRLVDKLKAQGYAHERDGKPKAMTKWIHMKPEEIITRYNAVIRGYLNYYSFVNNRNMLQRIVWILRFSAVFTFARKWRISPKKVFRKLGSKLTYRTTIKTSKGTEQKSYTLDLGDLSIRPMKFDLIASKKPSPFDPAKI